jgi:hypothetical protein
MGLMRRCTKGRNGSSGLVLTKMMAAVAMTTRGWGGVEWSLVTKPGQEAIVGDKDPFVTP